MSATMIGPIEAATLVVDGIAATKPASAIVGFDPTGSSGIGTASLVFAANPGKGMPSLNVVGVPQDGTGSQYFLRCDAALDIAKTPRIQMPSVLELYPVTPTYPDHYELWIGGNPDAVPPQKGMYVWTKASEDAIDLQGLTVGGAFDQDIRINALGGGVQLGKSGGITEDGDLTIAGDFTAQGAIIDGSPVRTFANSPDAATAITVEHVFTAAGTANFTHGLNTPNPIYSVYSLSGAKTWSVDPVDNNSVAVTVPAAADIICSFLYAPAPAPGFSFTMPSLATYVPTLARTNTIPVTITQTPTRGFSAPVTYSLPTAAAGMAATFAPNPLTGGSGNTTMSLQFPYNQPSGTNAFTVQGTSGTLTQQNANSVNIATTNNGLVAGYASTEGSGATLLDTANVANAACNNITWTKPTGWNQTVATFNGSTSYATPANNTNTNFDGTQPFSVAMWASFNDAGPTPVEKTLITNGITTTNLTGFFILRDNANQLHIYLINNINTNNMLNSYFLPALPSNANPQHIVVTYDGSRTAAGIKVYLNGVALTGHADASSLTASIATANPMRIGARHDNSESVNGAIAFVRIYNRVVTSGEVSTLYTAGQR